MYHYSFNSAGRGNGRGAMPLAMTCRDPTERPVSFNQLKVDGACFARFLCTYGVDPGRIWIPPRRTADRPGPQRLIRCKDSGILRTTSTERRAAGRDRPRSGGCTKMRPELSRLGFSPRRQKRPHAGWTTDEPAHATQLHQTSGRRHGDAWVRHRLSASSGHRQK